MLLLIYSKDVCIGNEEDINDMLGFDNVVRSYDGKLMFFYITRYTFYRAFKLKFIIFRRGQFQPTYLIKEYRRVLVCM